jgi:hypothetical protein
MNFAGIPPVSSRALLVAAVALAFLLFVGWDVLHDDGTVGATRKNGFGCTCHDFQPSDSVHVWIAGPQRVPAGSVTRYELLMTGGPAVEGGFNAAAQRGLLSAADSTAKLLPSVDGPELTHTVPKVFAADTVRWEFFYHAPADTTEDTLYSVGNSVNGNGVPTGDQFNFGANFIVDLGGDSATGVASGPLPARSALAQNYPNPFNPSTTIRYEVGAAGLVELAVSDVAGRTVRTLVRERQAPGVYAVAWDAQGLPSGMYFCTMRLPGFSAARKMLLLR